MSYDKYTSFGGANYFVSKASEKLGYTIDQVEVTGTQIGSVIVLFNVFSTANSGTITSADIALKIQKSVAAGDLALYGNDVIVMDGNAVVLLPGNYFFF